VAAVEFAIVAPLLLFVLMGTVEVGRGLVHYDRVSYNVRDSARFVSQNAMVGSTGVIHLEDGVIARAKNIVVYGNEAGTGEPVLPNFVVANVTVTDAGNGDIRVAVTYPYHPMLLDVLPDFLLGGSDVPLTFNMPIAVTMRAIS
jgi:hypothetical protein